VRSLSQAQYERGIEALRNREHGEHALVIGNSPWRKTFPVGAWFGPTIACNAYWRDADRFPSYLVAFDPNLIKEQVIAKCYENSVLVFRENEGRPAVLERIPLGDRGKWFHVAGAFDIGSLAGSLAIALAGWLGCKSITLVGFSLSHDNLYVGTEHYREDRPDAAQRAAGSRCTDHSRIRRAIDEYHRLSPGGSVHWITPGTWMLAALESPDRAAV